MDALDESFMAGFFLTFSFFKLLDLKGFAESYAMYDILAKRWNGWGYLYAFIELGLGIAFLTGFHPLLINAVTFVVMTISIIGVLQSVMNKRKIQMCLPRRGFQFADEHGDHPRRPYHDCDERRNAGYDDIINVLNE